MSIHINRFIDSVKAHEARQQQTFSMSLREAKDLHADISKLLLQIVDLQSEIIKQNQTLEVRVSAPGF